jgi:pyruvate formate-lyase/glycerol dehydratase family glycyl radical enzyme
MATTQKVKYNSYPEESRGTMIWDYLNPKRYTQTMSMARASILTEGYHEFAGYHLWRKRGLVTRKILNEMPIYIDDHQLLCGDFGAKPMGPEFFPDLAGDWINDYIENYGVEGRKGFYAWEDEEQMAEGSRIGQYWKIWGGKETYIQAIGPEDAKFEDRIGEAGSWIVNTVSEMFAEKGWNVPDVARIITKGVTGLVADIDAKIESMEYTITDYEGYTGREMLKGLREGLLGMVDYAHRYRDLCNEMADKEKDPIRKAELEEMARVCNRVPEFPAETFQESLQSFFFGVLGIYYDSRTYGMGNGRVDQFMYPQYKADIESGKIDDEYVLQLLECFRCKTMGKRSFWPDVMTANLSAESHFHNTTLCGVLPEDGKDATNELSYLWLEAAVRCRTPHPTLSVRWHDGIDPKFMDRAMEVVALGMGFPAFFGDEASMNFLLARGYTIQEARSLAYAGCTLHTVPGRTSTIWPLVTSYGRILEIAMYNGWDFISNTQLGPKTGDFEKMKSYEEFWDAFVEQIKYWTKISTASGRMAKLQHQDSFPPLMMSAFVDDCIETAKLAANGGARSKHSSMYMVPVAVQDVANELYVIKYGIFGENPICSPSEMMTAMRANWEGHEELRAKCLAMPKFGNDIDEVDVLLRDVYNMLYEIWSNEDATHGAKYELSPHSIGFHGGTGAKTGALPCGRKAGTAFADGAVSPAQGTDKNGPSAVIASAGSIDQDNLYGALFNMRFQPQALKDKEGRDNLKALMKTYFSDYKGKHLQFNVLNQEEMMAAKKEPEKYTDLMVRVAGYSAYWTDLPDNIQDELIARSGYESV